MSRSIKACMNCGETRDIAAHGLCFKCYRQEERKLADELWARPDPNAKELAKTQRKTRKALMKMLDALEEIEVGKLVPEATTEAWRMLLRPEIERIALSLGEAQVNGESRETGNPFTGSAEAQRDSEQQSGSERFTDPADSTSQSSERVNSDDASASEQVNDEQQNVSEQFTDLADPTDSEQERASEVSEINSQRSEQVNSEHATASAQFTQPATPLNETSRSDQVTAEPEGTEKPLLLPPLVPQRITKVKKPKGNNLYAA